MLSQRGAGGLIAPAIDIYLTYRCNLRCRHCFVGERLESSRDFDGDLLALLINSCTAWSTREVTFLGGEPTLYPEILGAIEAVQDRGMRARIVTNGLAGLRRLILQLPRGNQLSVGFSIDGSTSEIHDHVRGRGKFAQMLENISVCKHRGLEIFGVTSISRQNSANVHEIVSLSRELGLEYLNMHYVAPVGFADLSLRLPIAEWRDTSFRVKQEAERLGVAVRVEALIEEDWEEDGDSCAVRNEDNLMFLPDGRVFRCPLFLDQPNAHSYLWTRTGLFPNRFDTAESAICRRMSSVRCPALALIDPGLSSMGTSNDMHVGCVLKKTSYGMLSTDRANLDLS